MQDSLVQLMRQGVDISLRSLQVWAELTRQLGPTALGYPTGATYELLEKLVAAQREVVDELVATQRHFAQGFLETTAIFGDGLASQQGPIGERSQTGCVTNAERGWYR